MVSTAALEGGDGESISDPTLTSPYGGGRVLGQLGLYHDSEEFVCSSLSG